MNFIHAWTDAVHAGNAAAAATQPVPMVVRQHANPLDDASPITAEWVVADGVCGFGWIHVAGNTGFGRWALRNRIARKDWPSGFAISSPLPTQSLTINEAWAHGAAEALKRHGIAASARSRID